MPVRQIMLLIGMLLCVAVGAAADAATVHVRDVAEDKERWNQWVRSGEVINLSGRYNGRVGRQLTLVKLEWRISPGRTAVLPADLDAGQRMTVSGTLQNDNGRYVLQATRIIAGPSDLTLLHSAARQLPKGNPEPRYELADKFAPIADFYGDDDLKAKVGQLREEAFALERAQLADDPAGLMQLQSRADDLGIDSSRQQALIFQALILRFQQTQKQKRPGLDSLLADIKKMLPGWDQQFDFSSSAIAEHFRKDPVAAYDSAEDFVRRKMHRRLYRQVRLKQILSKLEDDGSNGDQIAAEIVLELPEEQQAIDNSRKQYVEYRLKRVPFLTRGQLEDVELLLRKAGRQQEFNDVLDRWLQAQRRRLNDEQLNGMLMMADEYRFAWERWEQQRHADGAADLLKRAYMKSVKEAPREAKKILSQLEQLGWTRLHDRWMTRDDIRSLPKNDVELALRERRVVPGMSSEQVTSILGQPTRRVKVVSGRHVQEIWLFDDGGSQPISVHMQRRRFESAADAVCLLVTTAVQ